MTDGHVEAPVRRSWLLATVLLAVVLRASWALLVPVAPVSDSSRYDYLACNLARGAGYSEDSGPTAFWPVGPAFLYSLCYRLVGSESPIRFIPIVLLNLVLGTLSVWLTTILGARWFSAKIGLAAGVLLALWPSQIEFTTVLSSETPFIFLLLLALVVWTDPRLSVLGRATLTGAALAAASYMRPTALLLPAVFMLFCGRTPGRFRTTLFAATVAAATMFALILPWSLRNQRVFGQFVLISTNGGSNTWMGNNPATTGFYQTLPDVGPANEAERDRQLGNRAVQYIWQDPWSFVRRSTVKAVRLHERETIGVHWNSAGLAQRLPATAISVLKWMNQFYWVAMLGLAIVGAGRLAMRRPLRQWLASPPIAIWVYFTLVHAVTVIQDRYHFAYIPLLALLAGMAFSRRGVRRDEADPREPLTPIRRT
jgi:4-amino-4-deoxy-L-arabinose transferase-like glycosyltransferase